MTARSLCGGMLALTLLASTAALSGCDTPEGTAMLSALWGLNAQQADAADQAAAWSALSNVAGWTADQQAQQQLRQTPQTVIIEHR